LVVCNVLDHFVRRPDEDGDVIGALLGSKVGDYVEVRYSFPVPYFEREEELSIDVEYQRTMYDLHRKVDSKNVIVGWYATAYSDQSRGIHEIFAQRVANPVHLLVDPRMKNGTLNVRTLCNYNLHLAGKEVGTVLREVPFLWKTNHSERLALEEMIGDLKGSAVMEHLPAEDVAEINERDAGADDLHMTLKKLRSSLGVINEYVSKVLNGEVQEDKALGRQLHSIITTIPQIDSETFGKAFSDSVQDMLMVIYLAKLVKANTTVAEKTHNTMAGTFY
jgi:translation initiation factor 3 subunit F